MKQDMIVILDLGSEENPRLAREIRATVLSMPSRSRDQGR